MILVTGATGLVGSHLLVKLIKENQSVRALYRSEAKLKHTKKVFTHYFSKEEHHLFDLIEWYKSDLNTIPELEVAFAGIKEVYHCAAKISFNPSDYKKLRKINIEGTANIVNLSLLHNIDRLCYISSIATLSNNIAGNTITEDAEWNPETSTSVYAITKYGAELEVWRGIHEGLNAVIVNPGIIIGPGYFENGSGSIFKKIHKGMNYFTNGVTGYVGIHDVITSCTQLMKEIPSNERYILVAENLSYKEVFTAIAKALKKKIPSKEVSKFEMKIVYYIQRILYLLFKTEQSIHKSSLKSAFSIDKYENSKIKNKLNISFSPIENSIQETANYLLYESEKD